jgi:hypothetical protein
LGGGENWDFLYYQDKGQKRGRDTVTIRIELIPTLSHCIETVAKREYWRSVDEYLKKRKEDKELEEKIELLRSFLETEDFGILRRQSEKHLMNGKQVRFTLSIRNGKQAHEMTMEKTHEGKNECNRKQSCN